MVACGRMRTRACGSRQADPVPIPKNDLSALRREVGMLRARESRRIFDSMVAVGDLGGERQGFVVRAQDLPVTDAALRIDVVSSLVDSSTPQAATAWVTRAGTPDVHDVDLEWLAAATIAFGSRVRSLDGFYAITRAGWLDVRTGERRVWQRLRL